jgi:phenylpropionate dioxygenase-like ring-hydroxylating dioxygenase large terminal subunit
MPRAICVALDGITMALKTEDNEILTRVGGDSPMGRLLRQHWSPLIRSDALVADGAPVRVRIFGDDLVAFRATDGNVGVIDEACPHRGVSMALARNEDNGLRCIFHGWKLDVKAQVVDAPCEPVERRARFCAGIKTSKYVAQEAAGIVWVYLGQGDVPRFPAFEFMGLPADQVCIRRSVVPYNWVQGLEAHVDSSHVAFLHQGFLDPEGGDLEEAFRENLALMANDKVPKFEVQTQPYGLQESAIRRLGEEQIYARVREVALPFFTFIPGPDEGPFGGRMSVPIDDDTSTEWYIVYDPSRPLTPEMIRTTFHNTSDDPDNFAANLPTKDEGWKQDRIAMARGHYSGLTVNLSFEDFIVQSSMGSRVDRSREQLSSADIVLVKVRNMLLEAARSFQADGHVAWREGFEYGQIRARSLTYGPGQDWRDFHWDKAP